MCNHGSFRKVLCASDFYVFITLNKVIITNEILNTRFFDKDFFFRYQHSHYPKCIYIIDSDQRLDSIRRPFLKVVFTDVIISNHGPI